ncbi:excalibur calcium-binding domain-containing protein [Nocardioides sp. SYSU D00065]|uniref:excalibur calcium-binding domain-containing protein n=1 Tax=Nocardioides sp. SYSU D00065 TaxID=2817378 RepID=UPI001B31C1A2|nr:excalibur calcium-binding domain-containing protein [Nocardioides sp. SYSU D00065]
MRRKILGAIACMTIAAPAWVLSIPAEAAVPAQWQNCTVVNKRLPHGVGRANARDKTSGTPVTNFRRNTALYNTAIRANASLDRDKDGIACEKA